MKNWLPITIGAIGLMLALPMSACTQDNIGAGETERVEVDHRLYSLIREYADGSGYVSDYNMSIGDCYDRLQGVREVSPPEWTWGCYLQPDGEIVPMVSPI